VLNEKGEKLSKSKGNFPDPWLIFERYGVDALRLYLLSSPLLKAEDLNFSERGVGEVYKKTILRLRNVLAFYTMYSGKVPNTPPDGRAGKHRTPNKSQKPNSKQILDVWIISLLNKLIAEVTTAMENYKLDEATRPFADFADDLSTWWLRRSRDRIKNNELEIKNEALNTLRFVLIELSKLMAPFTPFVAEEIYQQLATSDWQLAHKESVHLESWPRLDARSQKLAAEVLENMRMVRQVVSEALEARAKAGIRVRQPLKELRITNKELGQEYLKLIKDEVNVKEIVSGDELKLDTTITPELKREGQLRELVRAIQDLRKKKGLNPSDKIILSISTDRTGKALVRDFSEELKSAVGAKEIKFEKTGGEKVELDGPFFVIKISD